MRALLERWIEVAGNDPGVKDLEATLTEMELLHGKDSIEVAGALQKYAVYLKKNNLRLLDAANMQARADVILEKRSGSEALPNQQPSSPNAGERARAHQVEINDREDQKTCPFCAEIIRRDAVYCRYCKQSLKEGRFLSRRTIAGLALLFSVALVIVFIATQMGSGQKPEMGSQSPVQTALNTIAPKATISGGAFVVMQSGSSEILRGQRIFLCRSDLVPALSDNKFFKIVLHWKPDQYPIDGYKYKSNDSDEFENFWFKEARNSIMSVVARNTIEATETDIEGKYRFANLPAGNYCVFSELLHPEYHKSKWCYWLVPVALDGESKSVDLSNSQMYMVDVQDPER